MDEIENPFLLTLRLPVKTSPILLVILIAVHIICLFLPWITALSLNLKIVLMCFLGVSFYFYCYKYRFCRSNQRVLELILGSEDNWQVKMSDDLVKPAELGHSLFIHPWLTIINLKYENNRETFIFTPETLDEDEFRRLRVRLRFKANK